MPNLNDIKLLGHLTRDADLRYTNNGKGVTNFTVAVNRDFGDGADFIKCTAWNRGNYELAKYTGEYQKGDLVFVAGSLRQENWEDKNGNKRTSFKVNVDKAYNFSRKPEKNEINNKGEDDEQFEIPDDFDVPF